MRNRLDWTALTKRRAPQTAMEIATEAATTGRSKYGNLPHIVDGVRFHSKLEADRYQELKFEQAAGEVLWFVRQVAFEVVPGVQYRCDFLVVRYLSSLRAETIVVVEDTKGFMTEACRIKIKAVEARYGIKIRLLRRADVKRFA